MLNVVGSRIRTLPLLPTYYQASSRNKRIYSWFIELVNCHRLYILPFNSSYLTLSLILCFLDPTLQGCFITIVIVYAQNPLWPFVLFWKFKSKLKTHIPYKKKTSMYSVCNMRYSNDTYSNYLQKICLAVLCSRNSEITHFKILSLKQYVCVAYVWPKQSRIMSFVLSVLLFAGITFPL